MPRSSSKKQPESIAFFLDRSLGRRAFPRVLRKFGLAIQVHAVFASGLRLIIVVGGDVPTDSLARNFVNAYPAIVKFAAKHNAPFIARLSRPGRGVVLDAGGHGQLRMYKSHNELGAHFGNR